MINWKLRIRNKATLITLIGAIVALVYQVLGVIGKVPAVSQTEVINWVGIVLNVLVGLGIVIDPTTSGIGDSPRALDYEVPSTDDGNIADYDDDDEEVSLEELEEILEEDDEDPEDDEKVEEQE